MKVVLAGQGADEPHGGYGRHQAAALLGGMRHVPPALAGPVASLARAGPARRAGAQRVAHLLGGRGDAERLLRLVEVSDAEVRGALCPAHRRRGGGRAPRACSATCSADVAGRGLLEQALYLDTRMFLPDGILICNDKMSMAAGLELRVPFLDRRADALRGAHPGEPPRAPARREAAPPDGDVAPAAAAGRGAPEARLRHPVRRLAAGVARARRCGAATRAGLRAGRAWSSPAAVARLVDEHARGRADHKSILYCLLELSEWHRAFVEAREPVAA